MVVADEEPALAAVHPAPPRRQLAVVGGCAAITLLADQLTKWWASDHLADGHVDRIVGSLRLRLAHNPGAAFSIGSGSNLGPLIAVLAVVVVAVLIATGHTTRTRLGAVAVGLIAGGAVGNIVDRALRAGSGFMGGHVVDFIDPQWWPTFNVADAGVVVGAVLLIVFGFRAPASPA